jgi:hypothetical protein
VLLIGGAGIAQAAHIHGDWLPHNAPQAGANSSQSGAVDEENCPLCIAMHSVLPVAGFAALLVALFLEIGLTLFVGRKPEASWYFAALSRPPPFLVIL